jgi:hypothetical protein
MKKSELEKVDNLVDDFLNIGEILKAQRGIYIYYNKPTKNSREIVLHRHSCGYCAFGSGTKTEKTPGKNGVWMGPFSKVSQAISFIKSSGINATISKKCNCLK